MNSYEYLCKFIVTNKTEKTFSPTLPEKCIRNVSFKMMSNEEK